MSPVRRLLVRAALALLLLLSALPAALGPNRAPQAAQVVRATPSATPTRSPRATPSAAQTLDDRPPPLSLDMAAGQMMAASFGGPSITDGLRHLILDEKVGTVLIFGDNFTDAGSLLRLTTQLQRLGREAGLPAPLLIAVDEEGGRVMRVHDGVAALASELELGARGPQGSVRRWRPWHRVFTRWASSSTSRRLRTCARTRPMR